MQGDKSAVMYCRKKLNEGEEKGSREARHCCLACSAQQTEKKSRPSKKDGDGGIEKRSSRVKRDG